MSFFETNMQSLAEKNSFLHQKIASIQDVEQFEIFMDEGDVSSLNFVHTKHFIPMYEDKAGLHVDGQIAEFKFFEEYPFLYFFGVGNGVLFKNLLASLNHKRIVIVEPELEVLYVVFHMIDISQEILSGKVTLVDIEEMNFARSYNLVKDYEVHRYAKVFELYITSNYYEKIYHEEVASTNKIFVDGLSHAISLAGNDPMDALIGLKHYVRNIPRLVQTPPLREMITKLHQAKTAVLVSTGPSLTKQLPLLKEIAEHVVIVAVDASFPVLYRAGIKPDVVVSIERVKESARFFTELPKEAFDDVVIALSVLQHDDVINSIKGGTVQMSLRPLSYMMHMGPEPWGYLGIGMSAANMGYELIFHSKFKNCILLGQDLAYAKDGSSHAKGHVFGEENVKGKESDFFVPAWDNNGEIKTNKTWNLFRKSFEKDIAETRAHMLTINATEGGAHIDGTVEISFEDAIEKYIDKSKSKQVPKLLNAVKEVQKSFLHETNDKVEEVKEYIQKLFTDVESLLSNLSKHTETALSNEEVSKLLIQINDIRSRANEPIYQNVIWHIAQSMLLAHDTEIARAEVFITKDEIKEQERVEFLLNANKEWFFSFMGILDAILKTITYAEARRLIDEVETIDVYVSNKKIDSFRCDELQATNGRVFDIDMRGILYDVPDEYQEKTAQIAFKDSVNSEDLPKEFVSVISREDEKYNELSFIKSLEETADEEKVQSIYTANAIGFLATKENLQDTDFMHYMHELQEYFQGTKFVAYIIEDAFKKNVESLFPVEVVTVKSIVELKHASILILNETNEMERLISYKVNWHNVFILLFTRKDMQKKAKALSVKKVVDLYRKHRKLFDLKQEDIERLDNHIAIGAFITLRNVAKCNESSELLNLEITLEERNYKVISLALKNKIFIQNSISLRLKLIKLIL